MTARCPYCGSNVDSDDFPVMSKRRKRIYQTVASAGHEGIETAELLARMYADEESLTPGGYTVMRVQIHEINKIIAHKNQAIRNGPRGIYRLVTVKGE